MKYEIVSGYFGPLHGGHIDYIRAASKRGDKLVVIVNNDIQQRKKKGRIIMDEKERCKIVMQLRQVDYVVHSLDADESVRKTLQYIVTKFGKAQQYEFCNGGDRSSDEIPEAGLCNKLHIKMVDGVGGPKTNSSTEVVKRWSGQSGS